MRRKGDLRNWIGHGSPSEETGDAKMHLSIRMLIMPLVIVSMLENRQV